MYLSKLEIFGFKSFAQKTPVNFHEGVTSIVGPNGCGKTNIVDAIRWCLGEQRTSTLRSDKMENVIFNGTSNRKPMGMAEVSLIIENTKGILPTEYTEVTITRRIFRSGESEYLLNKNICRLKDITNLFMDTGIGANAYSVIELKMVETILSNKAEERRTMFEEAAGVNKYKLRRRLALRKLEEVMSDLTRVNDIVTEVSKNVSSLERQAKKADRYTQLTSRLKEIELELAEREYSWFLDKSEEIILTKVENNRKRKNSEDEILLLQEKLSDIRQKSTQFENYLRIKRDEVNELTEQIYLLRSDVSVSNERQKSVDANLSKYENEIINLNGNIDLNRNNIEQAKSGIAGVASDIDKSREIIDELKVKIENASRLLEEKRISLKKHSEEIVAGLKKVSDKENELLNLTRTLGERNNQINKLNSKILHLTSDIAKTVGFIEALKEDKERVSAQLNETENNYAMKAQEKENLDKAVNEFRKKELELKNIIQNLNEKISFIQNLVDNLEGVSKGTKSLLDLQNWANGKVVLLANAGNSSDEFRAAIEAALRNNVNDILISSVDELKNGIEYLKNNNLGRAAFYLKQNGVETSGLLGKIKSFLLARHLKKIEAHPSFKIWTASVVQSDSNWKSFFDHLLHRTAVVDDVNSAIELSLKYPDFRFVTLEGDLADGSGLIESGSPVVDETLFGKRQLLSEIKSIIPSKQKELIELSNKIEEYELQIGKIDLKVLSDKGRMLVNDLANIDKQISQFEYEKKKANDEIEKTRQLVHDVAAESNKLDKEKSMIANQLEEMQRQRSTADSELKLLEDENVKAEQHFNQLVTEKNETKVNLERKLGEARNLQNVINRSEENIKSINNNILSKRKDIDASKQEIIDTEENQSRKEQEIITIESKKKLLIDELEKIESEYERMRSEGSLVENKISQIRTDKDGILDANRDLEIKLSEFEIKKNNLIEHINEEYSVIIERKKFDDNETFAFETNKAEVHDLRQKVRNLGPINLLAYSEYEEEKERLEFLNKQHDDLVESEKDIHKTIEEINLTAQAKFAETFDRIRENFIRVFRSLFDPGDEADLRLEENADPLEGKIEIIAKPKGKRPTSIELLSGGEKTLTAIALLFAIYLVKPSPFCILDEIDAPLDDANIDRFTKLIKEFSINTQFIVVTHNKRTMESADTLYGVTMQEEGVSKLVSVHFNEDINVVA